MIVKQFLFSTNRIFPKYYNIVRMVHSKEFDEACKRIKTLKEEPGNDIKLNLYALFKQATKSSCTEPKPSMFDMVGKAKWDAWKALGTMPKEEAQQKYVSLVDELCKAEGIAKEQQTSVSDSKYEGLIYTVKNDVTEIILNRPHKKNAITTKMYTDIMLALKEASQNDTAVTLLTGTGDYYSSGNDLSNFTNMEGDISSAAEKGGELLREFVAAFIDFPKVLVAGVNGPAVGIPVTLLGLCDIVYASDKATFQTPFSLLGQAPEGCSTYTFPRMMGSSKANEILLFNKKFTVVEAQEWGLVSTILPHHNFHDTLRAKLAEILSTASKQSMLHTKELIRGPEREKLHDVNRVECKRLVERWQSPDCMEALMRFFQRKSNL